MGKKEIIQKFGDTYQANQRTFVMGIDRRFTNHFAARFAGQNVLETCTGGGFTTISLAKTANHIYSVEIDDETQMQAISNVERVGLSSKVTFLSGDVLDEDILKKIPTVDSVFIDPDWAITGTNHKFQFLKSTTRPPSDVVLFKMLSLTQNVAIVLPPRIDVREFNGLPEHEMQRLYLGDSHELFCLYFGTLRAAANETEFRVVV